MFNYGMDCNHPIITSLPDPSLRSQGRVRLRRDDVGMGRRLGARQETPSEVRGDGGGNLFSPHSQPLPKMGRGAISPVGGAKKVPSQHESGSVFLALSLVYSPLIVRNLHPHITLTASS